MSGKLMITGLWHLSLVLQGAPLYPEGSTETEPAPPKQAGAYKASPRSSDGTHMALTVEKLTRGVDPPRPLLIWAIGSSFTKYQGDGDQLISLIRKRFPGAPQIVYKSMVGGSTPYHFLRGWARHLVIPDQPDVVLIYNFGSTEELENLIVELRTRTTADIIVPTLHWCKPHRDVWPDPEAPNRHQDPAGMRAVCARHGVEFVENRRELTQYMTANGLEIEDLLVDTVHQSPYAATMINMNIARHFHRAERPAYEPQDRERRIDAAANSLSLSLTGDWKATNEGRSLVARHGGSSIEIRFTGKRIDLVGWQGPDGGSVDVWIDGQPAGEAEVYYATYVKPAEHNTIEPNSTRVDYRRATSGRCPHSITLGKNIVPQKWTVTMTSDEGDYELVGSVTGFDGQGNALKAFTSQSGQIVIDPDLWRLAYTNFRGDQFTFEVRRTARGRIDFKAPAKRKIRTRLIENLPHGTHCLRLVTRGDGPVVVDAFEVYEPPISAVTADQ